MRVLCTAGHVDHGKSTLVRALTGTDPDRLAEEQRRGLTIELGFAWTQLAGVGDVAFVDLPGHERFVPTMLAGAGPVEVALLVVAADEGWMPQSAEHLAILRLLDVRHGVVALTRTDLVDDDTVEIAAELVREELEGSGLADARIVGVSAVTGAGLDDLRGALAEVLAAAPPPADAGRARLWIDRAFTIRGAGTVVTGTLGGGSVAVGEVLVTAPGGVRTRVRGVQALGRSVDAAAPGWRVALNLVGVEVADVPRGSAVLAPDRWPSTASVDAWCTPEGAVLGRRGAWRVHVGTAEVGASLYPTGGIDLAEPGPVRIELDHPLPLAAGDRLVIRDAGRGATAGGGIVLDPLPRRRPRGRGEREAALGRLAALAAAQGPDGRLAALVADRGWVHGATVRAMAGAPGEGDPDDVDPPGVEVVGDQLLSADAWAQLSGLVMQAVAGVHQQRPALPVVERPDARRLAGGAGAPPEVVDAVVDRLVADGRLEAAPGGVRVPGHTPQLTAAQAAARDALVRALDAAGWEVDALAELAAAAGADDDLLAAMAREGALVDLGDGRATTPAVLDRAVGALRTLAGPFTAAEARDALATTRKHALPLLEALDARGLTRRDGDTRTLTDM